LDAAKRELQLCQPPFLPAIQAELQRLTTAAVISGSPEDRSAVVLKNQELIEARKEHQKHDDLVRQVQSLAGELEAAQYRERMERIRVADEALSRAYNDYVSASFECARKFRKYIATAKANANVPGASHVVRQGQYDLHLPPVWPNSWNGTSGQFQRDGLLPFEVDEQREAARLEA
jgi:hypothetical protein